MSDAAPFNLTDTHCHLDFERFDADRLAVLRRAAQAGVDRLLNPALDLFTCARAIQLANDHKMVYASVGVHPNSAMTWEANTLSELRRLATHPKVVAIGEIGLDYYWDRAPADLQQEVLRRQLDLATELSLPVVIHNREAGDDLLPILVEWQRDLSETGGPLAENPGVLHSFSGDQAMAEAALKAGFFLGFTGPVTFKNAPDLQGLVTGLPLDRILIETDAPFLTPHPHRGQRNEPAHVRLVADKIASLKGLSVEQVASQTWLNAKRLFRW